MKPASNKKRTLKAPSVELPKSAIQLMSVCVMATALAACGGSSGGSIEGGSEEPDPNGLGGFGDLEPEQVLSFGEFEPSIDDPDGDGLFADEEFDLGTDPLDADSDGNGIFDGDEDNDGDGDSNLDEVNNGSDPTDAASTIANPTGAIDTDPVVVAQSCDDPDSSNETWIDNCQLNQFGTFATSSYTQGVQRILFCQGSGGAGSTIGAFADGIFGPNTELAVMNFQTENNLLVDGIVGPETWGALFETLNLIPVPDLIVGDEAFATYAVDGCSTTLEQFYQEVDGIELLGWRLALTPGSATPVPFSTGAPN